MNRPTATTTVALTLAGEESATTHALKWLTKRLLRTFGVRVVALRVVHDHQEDR